MESLNRAALELVDEAIDFADELDIDVHHLDNDATVIDFGVNAGGGIEPGLLLSEIQTGGLATVQTRVDAIAGSPRTHVELATDHPVLSLLGSAFADWQTDDPGLIGSGPARLFEADARFRPESYEEDFDFAVLSIEADRFPSESFATDVANRCGVPTSGVFLPTFSTTSLTGCVAMAARAGEVALIRLAHLGYDVSEVHSLTASAPVAPVATTSETAIARVNDAIAYGARVHLDVESNFSSFDALPFGSTEYAGTSMRSIFESADWNLHSVPDGAFAPAAVTIDVRGDSTYTYGERNESLLAEFLG